MTKPKIVLWDIESSYMLMETLGFSRWDVNIPFSGIKEDWRIHCVAWKEWGKPRIYSAVEKDRCDREVVEEVAEMLRDVDVLIHHNGDKFDLKKFNSRLIYHGFDPIPPKIYTIDTLKAIKRVATFSSHRLDDLGEMLGVGRKIQNAPGLWERCFYGDAKALKEMVKYNKQDVVLLEDFFNRVHKYLPKQIHRAILGDLEGCNSCGSFEFQKRGYLYTAAGKKQRYQCQECGSWWHSSKSEQTTEKRV